MEHSSTVIDSASDACVVDTFYFLRRYILIQDHPHLSFLTSSSIKEWFGEHLPYDSTLETLTSNRKKKESTYSLAAGILIIIGVFAYYTCLINWTILYCTGQNIIHIETAY